MNHTIQQALEERLKFRFIWANNKPTVDTTFRVFHFTLDQETYAGNIHLEKWGKRLLCCDFYPHGKLEKTVEERRQQRPRLGSASLYLALCTAYSVTPGVQTFEYQYPTEKAKIYLRRIGLTAALQSGGVPFTDAVAALERYLRKKEVLTYTIPRPKHTTAMTSGTHSANHSAMPVQNMSMSPALETSMRGG